MSKFKTIAFYTKGTPYESEAKELVKNAKQFNIDVEIVGYPNRGQWVKNAALKPIFISSMMEKYKKVKFFLYIDVDARFRAYPILFDNFTGDFGVHYRKRKSGQPELLSGTIFIRNTKAVHDLIKRWIRIQDQNPDTWDQKTLAKAIKGHRNLNIIDLPPAYTQIFDVMAHHGKPIIEHMQASRRYRNNVNEFDGRLPQYINGLRLRRAHNGIIYITRQDPKVIAWLDKNCVRLDNQLKWYPCSLVEKDIQRFQPDFYRKSCYIVGKGPSLDDLTKKYFTDIVAPIIALNEAIHKVEQLNLPNPIFCLQQDAKLQDTCYPKKGRLLVSVKAANWYTGRPRVSVFDSRRYKLSLNSLSVSVAIRIAASLGTKKIILISFDACINGKTSYAEIVGYESAWGGNPARFLDHRKRIEKRLGTIPAEWIIPKECAESASGK